MNHRYRSCYTCDIGDLLRSDDPADDPSLEHNRAFVGAAISGYDGIVELMMRDDRVDINDRCNKAIRLAMIRLHTEVVDLLLPYSDLQMRISPSRTCADHVVDSLNLHHSINEPIDEITIRATYKMFKIALEVCENAQYSLLRRCMHRNYSRNDPIIKLTLDSDNLDIERCERILDEFPNRTWVHDALARKHTQKHRQLIIEVGIGLKQLDLPVLVQLIIVSKLVHTHKLKMDVAWEISKYIKN